MQLMTDPEQQLILACVRACAGSGTLDDVRRLLETVRQWDVVLRQASRHAVMLQVAHALAQAGRSDVPVGVVTELRRAALDGARKNLQLTATLLELLDRFDSQGIRTVPFKGPALAALLYGDAALRYSVDLDILVRRQDVEAAADLLCGMGYYSDLPAPPAARAAYLRSRHEVHFTTDRGDCLIELHHAFLPAFRSFRLDYDALWTRLEQRTFGPREILTFRPDDLLLTLCAHATKHSWATLGWIADIARLLHIAGGEVVRSGMARASSIGAGRMIRVGLVLAGDLLHAPVPPDMWRQATEDTIAVRLADSVKAALFDEARVAGELQSHLFFLRARERLRDRVAYCGRLAFVPTEQDHAVLSLPRPLAPLYYPFHTARVGMKYARAWLRAAVGADPTDRR